MKLYSAYTMRENYKNRDSVTLDWFCDGRKAPVAPYEELIGNFGELTLDEQKLARKLADQFLTQSEVRELTDYVKRTSGFEVKTREVQLPIPDGNKIPDYSKPSPPLYEGELLPLHEAGDYTLSVPVSGFFDLGEPPNLVSPAQ